MTLDRLVRDVLILLLSRPLPIHGGPGDKEKRNVNDFKKLKPAKQQNTISSTLIHSPINPQTPRADRSCLVREGFQAVSLPQAISALAQKSKDQVPGFQLI